MLVGVGGLQTEDDVIVEIPGVANWHRRVSIIEISGPLEELQSGRITRMNGIVFGLLLAFESESKGDRSPGAAIGSASSRHGASCCAWCDRVTRRRSRARVLGQRATHICRVVG